MSAAAHSEQTVHMIKYTRFETIVQAVRDARTKDLAFMHAARMVECMEDLEDMLTVAHALKTDAFTTAERTFEDVLRTTPFLKNKLGLLCPRLVKPVEGMTVYRVIGAATPMPDSHNKVRGQHVHVYLTSADDMRVMFTNATDEDFAPGLLDFLDTLNSRRPNEEREMVLLELKGDGTFTFGDLPGYNVFVRDSLEYPWMNYVGMMSFRTGTMTNAAAVLRDRMAESEMFAHVRSAFGGIIFAPVGPRPGHWNTYVAECPNAPRRTRRRVVDDE